MRTHTASDVIGDITDVDDFTRRAVQYVVQLQGIIDSVETTTEQLHDGRFYVLVHVDYEPQEPS